MRIHYRWSFTTIAIAPLLLAAPTVASADTVPLIDVHVGLGYWQPTLAGDVASDGKDFDVEDDLDFERNSTNMLELGVEHAIPLLPNVRLRHLALDDAADSTLTVSRTFGPVTFQDDEDIRSEYDLRMTDATFYYKPIDNWIALDLGITARYMDLEVELASRERDTREQAGGAIVIPMAHVGLRADLPLTGLYASAAVDAISADGNSLHDARAGLGWESARLFGIEAGYREMALDVDDEDDLDADIDFSGAYVQASLRF